MFRPLRSISLVLTLSTALLLGACASERVGEPLATESARYAGSPSGVFLSIHGVGSETEARAYYAAVLQGDDATTYTLATWKRKFLGGAPVFTALYRNRTELGFWREMTCTQLIARGVGGCTVSNWDSPNTPATHAPNEGTVAMNVSPEGYARFYVFLPNGKLSFDAVLDREGAKSVPRLCTVCHGGSSPSPGTRADLGAVFREFDPDLLLSRPGLPRVLAEQEWYHLNRSIQQANHAIRSEAEGAPLGTDHARAAVNARVDALYMPGGDPDAVPASWAAAGPEAIAVWSKVMVPHCLGCHRHNGYDWTDYGQFSWFRDPSLRGYLPDAPDPDAPFPAMPQSAQGFDRFKRDRAAQEALTAWIGDGAVRP